VDSEYYATMREFIKVVCVLVLMGCAIASAIAWFDDRPNAITWLVRIVPAVMASAALGVFLYLHGQRDLAPDFLAEHAGSYMDRNGFCFSVEPVAANGVCTFRFLFQNRFENECIARIAIRPVAFVGKYETLALAVVRCPGGAFGIAEKAVGLPTELQGQSLKLDVGADVEYPTGKGRQLRFRDAIVLRRNTNFVDAFARSTTILALLGGAILWHRPVRVRCSLPRGVAKDISDNVPEPAMILWKLGDPPLHPAT
jgi:hypothetical protein